MSEQTTNTAPQLTAKLKGSRRWTVNANGVLTSLTRRYLILRNGLPAGIAAEEVNGNGIVGLPVLKSAHTTGSPLICSGYSFEEGDENAKRVLYCDVSFSSESTESGEANRAPRGQAVEAFGWKSGTVSRDLVRDAGTGAVLVNSAGLPFDSVPQIDIPAPTLTKVLKTSARQSWAQYQGKINSGGITMGGVSCGSHCVRCVQMDEERLWNDEFGFKYKYTIGLQLMTNSVCVGNSATPTDIGWDVAVVDCGTMERERVGAEAKMITIVSAETGKPVFVSSPVLLDGQGHANLAEGARPYVFRVQAYPATTFPGDFYSEPL